MDFGKDVFDLIMELISLYDFGRSACNKLMEKSQFEKNRSARTDISVQLQEKLHTFMVFVFFIRWQSQVPFSMRKKNDWIQNQSLYFFSSF